MADPKKITFETNGGSSVSSQTILRGKTVSKPKDPTRIGHDFAGWYRDNNTFTDGWDFGVVPGGDMTLYAKWDEIITGPSLSGTATTSGDYRIGHTLTVNTGNILGDSGVFEFQWQANGADIVGATSNTYTIQGVDADKTIVCVITSPGVASRIRTTAQTVPFDLILNITGNEASDSITLSSDYGISGQMITLSYTVDDIISASTDMLIFSGVINSIPSVSSAGSGTRVYTVNSNDAVNGVITIATAFSHTNLTIAPISFTASSIAKTYGDMPFTNNIASGGDIGGAITYSSSDTAVATINAGSGEVTILKAGIAIVTVQRAADSTYAAASDSFTLTVSQAVLTISGFSITKVFDGTNAVSGFGTLSFAGLVSSETAAVDSSSVTATYSQTTVGTMLAITIYNSFAMGSGTADAGNYSITQPASITGAITIYSPTAAPEPPEVSSATHNSITLTAPTGGDLLHSYLAIEYAVSLDSTAPTSGWQDSLIFSGLNSNTFYYFFARYKYDATRNNESIASEAITMTTDAAGNFIWTEIIDSAITTQINAIASGPGGFVACGVSGGMAYSNDGITWVAVTSNTFGTDYIFGITYGNDRFIAVGDNGRMAYSTNGINWTAVADSTFGTDLIKSVAYGNGRFVAGGANGKMAYSDDYGITWVAIDSTASTFGANQIGGITYGNGWFVATGGGGRIAYSDDGITWTAVADSTFVASSGVEAIAFGDNKFIAVGSGGRIAYSDNNGVEWTAVTSTFGTTDISAIAYGKNRFVAVGASGKMAYSDDGINWTAVSNPFGSLSIRGIAYGLDRFVACGVAGIRVYADW